MKPVNQRMQGGARNNPQQDPAQEQGALIDTSPLNEEEQTMYTQVAMAASDVITNEKTAEAILNQLKKGAQNPQQAIGDTGAMILVQLDEQSNGTIPEEIIFLPLPEIVEQLGEVVNAAKLFPVDQSIVAGALQVAVGKVADAFGISAQDVAMLIDGLTDQQRQDIVRTQGGAAAPGAAQPGAAPAQAQPQAAPAQAEV